MRILVVRLSALGDLVHTLPVVAALRRALPDSRVDWLVDERFRELVNLVPAVERAIGWPRVNPDGIVGFEQTIAELREQQYDVALDLQGLLKSAAAAWLSGARRVVGFEPAQLRETATRWLHSEYATVDGSGHVVEKNLALARHLGVDPGPWEFPLRIPQSPVVAETRRRMEVAGDGQVVLLNPGTAWESKCWDPSRYGELASRLRLECGLRSAVSWGPSEKTRAEAVVSASNGSAVMAPPTGLSDLVALLNDAALVVAGDTGPLHLAAAVGTPVVGIYGPSDPVRNGPWAPTDRVVSARGNCRCCEETGRSLTRGVVVRRCRQPRSCLDDVSVADVFTNVVGRLGVSDVHG